MTVSLLHYSTTLLSLNDILITAGLVTRHESLVIRSDAVESVVYENCSWEDSVSSYGPASILLCGIKCLVLGVETRSLKSKQNTPPTHYCTEGVYKMLFTPYLLTYPMEQRLPWEANRSLDSHEIPQILLNSNSQPNSQVPVSCPYPVPRQSRPSPQPTSWISF